MNAAETIQAAIDNLERLKATVFPGKWEALTSGVAHGDHWYVTADDEAICGISANDGSDEDYRQPTATLIVTLYRTIDAQLAFLRDSLARLLVDVGEETIGNPEVHYRHPLALARAILGDPS